MVYNALTAALASMEESFLNWKRYSSSRWGFSHNLHIISFSLNLHVKVSFIRTSLEYEHRISSRSLYIVPLFPYHLIFRCGNFPIFRSYAWTCMVSVYFFLLCSSGFWNWYEFCELLFLVPILPASSYTQTHNIWIVVCTIDARAHNKSVKKRTSYQEFTVWVPKKKKES